MKKIKKLAYPYNVWMVFLIIAPLLLVVYYGFTNGFGDLTLDNFVRIFERNTLKTLGSSILIALISTIICLVIGYPMAYMISRTSLKYRQAVMMMVMIPMWMNFLLRTYAWVTILSPSGILNSVLSALGLGTVDLMFTQEAIILGMVYNFLPFMILPIYTALEKMDFRLIEAAHDLGANKTQALFKVIVPMSLPGVFSGIAMVFVPAISTFEITRLLGGGKVNMIGNIIEQQFINVGDWNFGSALALILMIFIVISILLDRESVETGGKNAK